MSGGGFGVRGAADDSGFRPPMLPPGKKLSAADSADLAAGNYFIFDGDTLFSRFLPPLEQPHRGITDADYYAIADSLGVEAAAIKAVVDIETGSNRTGFHSDGRPLVNFDLGIFKRIASQRGVSLAQGQRAYPETFSPLNIPRYGSHQAAHYARLDGALAIDSVAAIEATFWGMFQIAGFNWKLAGAANQQDFVDRVSRSEYDQLILFANFIRNSGLLKHLRTKNWTAFAKLYNGPGYARYGYHTRMANAYARNRRTMR